MISFSVEILMVKCLSLRMHVKVMYGIVKVFTLVPAPNIDCFFFLRFDLL